MHCVCDECCNPLRHAHEHIKYNMHLLEPGRDLKETQCGESSKIWFSDF